MAITYAGAGTLTASVGPDITPPLYASWAANDIDLLLVLVRDVDDAITVTGWTLIGSAWDRSTVARYWLFGRRLQSGDTAPLVDKTGSAGDTFAMHFAFRGCITSGTAWETVGATATGTTDPATLTGITTASVDNMIVALLGGEDNNNGAVTITATSPAAYTEVYAESATGADGMLCMGYEIRSGAAGATGNVSVDFDTAVPVGWGGLVIALKPVSSTVTYLAITETAQFAEAPTKKAKHLITETAQMSDVVVKEIDLLIAETWQRTETFVRKTSKAITETWQRTEALTKKIPLVITETKQMSEALTSRAVQMFKQAFTETWQATEALTSRLALHVSFAETWARTEAFNAAVTLRKAISETWQRVEALATTKITGTGPLSAALGFLRRIFTKQ